MLTDEQISVLAWMVETGLDSYILASVHGPGPNHSLLDGTGGERFLTPGDLHELEALRLVRSPKAGTYEVTNAGRDIYEQWKNPPPERPAVGFQHS
jgi:hypothetical protein